LDRPDNAIAASVHYATLNVAPAAISTAVATVVIPIPRVTVAVTIADATEG
jgi:hypothetical protein